MIRISIVEDIVEMRDLLKSIIHQDHELSCISEHGGCDDAIVRIPDLDPDIVLLDINLNGESGIDIIKKIKEQNRKIQFLMCTVFQDDEKIFNSLKSGATGYILKRSSGDEIRQSIKDLYRGGSPMSPEIARRVVSSFLYKKKDGVGQLSSRESEILGLIKEGLTYKLVGEKLFISPATVRNHLHSIYEKLQVKNKTEAINKYQN
jgi:NarL family two-component system response regulator LiaR